MFSRFLRESFHIQSHYFLGVRTPLCEHLVVARRYLSFVVLFFAVVLRFLSPLPLDCGSIVFFCVQSTNGMGPKSMISAGFRRRNEIAELKTYWIMKTMEAIKFAVCLTVACTTKVAAWKETSRSSLWGNALLEKKGRLFVQTELLNTVSEELVVPQESYALPAEEPGSDLELHHGSCVPPSVSECRATNLNSFDLVAEIWHWQKCCALPWSAAKDCSLFISAVVFWFDFLCGKSQRRLPWLKEVGISKFLSIVLVTVYQAVISSQQ